MRIIIGADMVPTESNKELFVSGDKLKLFGSSLINVLEGADFRVINLETPLTDSASPIQKKGPAFKVDRNTVAGYAAAGVDLVTLANNHIMDQGEQGLLSTIEVLKANGIQYFGAGRNLSEASKPFLFKCDNRTVGFYACAEHEFSIAGKNTSGANPFDSLDTPDHISELKEKCDFLIVLYHGGKEHYRYPSPLLQKRCRKMIQKGAGLVICQHSHCIGCEEKYKGGTIVYGQGNFLFDNRREEWRTGLLVRIEDDFEVSYVPIIKNNNTVMLAENEQADEIMRDFHKRSEDIQVDGFIENEYKQFSNRMLQGYLRTFAGKEGKAFRFANKVSGNRLREGSLNKKYDMEQKIAIRNFIECEAHRELVLAALKNNDNH